MLDQLYIPRVIYKTPSRYNGEIHVIDEGKVRRIKVQGVTQSLNWNAKVVEKMYWGKSVELLKQHAPEITNILILGMAGGTLCHLISHAFPDVFIESIEIDPEMVDIAKKYFDVDSIPNHKIITDDALAVVAQPERVGLNKDSFDAIFVDIFCGRDYPDLGSTGTFISGIKNLLRPGGIVIFNRLYLPEFRSDVDIFLHQLEEQFDDVVSEVAPGRDSQTNMLILGRMPK